MLFGSNAIGTIGIMAGVPAVLTAFQRSLVKMVIHSRETLCDAKQHIHYDEAPFSDHGPARNHLVSRFMGQWLLMLDTDHEFEPDLLVRILDRADKHGFDVMTGLYRFKTSPCTPVLYSKNPEGSLAAITRWPRDAIFPVVAAGAGCLWIRRKVIEAIEATGEMPFDRLPGLSEDHSFFRRLDNLGIKTWCDPRIECHHLRVDPVTDVEHDHYRESEPFAVEGIPI